MKYFLLFLIMPMALFAGAQDGNTQTNIEKYPKAKWRKKVKMATKKMDQGNYQSYYNSAQYLEDAYKQKPDKERIAHLLAIVKRNLRDYKEAEKYYQVVITEAPAKYVNDRFYLGQMQKMNGKYEDAKKTFGAFLNSAGDANLKTLAKVELAGCDTALVLFQTPSNIKVEKTTGDVNTVLQDLSPKPINGKKILFASEKTDTAVDIIATRANYHTSIFTAELSGSSYVNRTILPPPINDRHYSTGNAIYSNDEQTIVYNRCTDSLSMGNRIRCKLFRATKKNVLEWNEPVELVELNYAEGTTTEPAWGIDAQGNDILYFASDRTGTYGGLDIYFAKLNNDGSFGAVTNAGPEVNTLGEEVTPFYDHKNKVLYFSSDGHPSLGGLDVFKISGTPGNWGAAINAGVPINSSADDLYLALDDKATKGFLVSNRAGATTSANATCCDDIWSVTLAHDITFKGIYTKRDDINHTPVKDVDVVFYKQTGNDYEVAGKNLTTYSPFLYAVNQGASYRFKANKTGYNPSIDELIVAEDEERDTVSQTFYLDTILKYHLGLPNVYFAFDKSNVLDFYKREIDSVGKILAAHPNYSLEIQAHTDSKGTDAYNQKLSLRRANEVDAFLINQRKITGNRIAIKAFGDRMPAVSNELPNGEDDPEGRARNRRVEFKVITNQPLKDGEFENYGKVIKEVKTGPGFTTKERKPIVEAK